MYIYVSHLFVTCELKIYCNYILDVSHLEQVRLNKALNKILLLSLLFQAWTLYYGTVRPSTLVPFAAVYLVENAALITSFVSTPATVRSVKGIE